jgi:predicted TIM-barrel fold metal-dependent hydrolase
MPVEIPPIISVDDHVVEPPDLFERWLPAKFRDRAPKVIRAPFTLDDEGRVFVASSGPETDFWAYEDLRVAIRNGSAAVGLDASEIDYTPVRYADMRPGFYERKARLEDMTVNHIERSVCFPTFPRFCGQTFKEAQDKELALACVRAYNDWMVDEWCDGSGGRLIPLCIIPLWDVHLAAEEVRRNARRGVRAVAFSELPSWLGLPSIHDANHYWDPFLQACDETGTVVCIHIGSASKFTQSSSDAPRVAKTAGVFINSQLSFIDWLTSGVLVRFQSLKVAFSEGQIGWMPFVLERLDNLWHKARAGAEIDPSIIQPPSTYVPGRIFGCFFEDDFGLASRNSIGIDQITFESDYPHQDSLWPDTLAYAQKAMAGLTQEEIYKVVRGNAIGLFQLPVELPETPFPSASGSADARSTTAHT